VADLDIEVAQFDKKYLMTPSLVKYRQHLAGTFLFVGYYH